MRGMCGSIIVRDDSMSVSKQGGVASPRAPLVGQWSPEWGCARFVTGLRGDKQRNSE